MKLKSEDYHYHFAGGWQKEEDKEEFFKYINLENKVTFHGFVNGEQKKDFSKTVVSNKIQK